MTQPAFFAHPAVAAFESLPTSALTIPPSLQWYCNAAHVTADSYERPAEAPANAKLIHLIYVQRHHKRTPDNLLSKNENSFNPSSGWRCDDVQYFNYAERSESSDAAVTYASTYIPSWNPLLSQIWNGTCDQGQLTGGGLADSIAHGRDFWSVYGDDNDDDKKNALLDRIDQETVFIRTSPEERTKQVAAGFLQGMGYPSKKPFQVHASPSVIDGIVPSYSCSHADQLRKEIESESEWKRHLQEQASLFTAVNDILGTANDSGWNRWIDHAFDFLSSRQCHQHPLPINPSSGRSISQETADRVYEEGNWEYNYIWNTSPKADEYVRYTFAVFVEELVQRLRAIQDGGSSSSMNNNEKKHKLTAFVGHDGTMVRLFKTLGMPTIQWPGMGSEVIFEIYQTPHSGNLYTRILAHGRTFISSAEVLTRQQKDAAAAWIPLERLLSYLQDRIPSDLFEKCTA